MVFRGEALILIMTGYFYGTGVQRLSYVYIRVKVDIFYLGIRPIKIWETNEKVH